jgi:hypothetical protein
MAFEVLQMNALSRHVQCRNEQNASNCISPPPLLGSLSRKRKRPTGTTGETTALSIGREEQRRRNGTIAPDPVFEKQEQLQLSRCDTPTTRNNGGCESIDTKALLRMPKLAQIIARKANSDTTTSDTTTSTTTPTCTLKSWVDNLTKPKEKNSPCTMSYPSCDGYDNDESDSSKENHSRRSLDSAIVATIPRVRQANFAPPLSDSDHEGNDNDNPCQQEVVSESIPQDEGDVHRNAATPNFVDDSSGEAPAAIIRAQDLPRHYMKQQERRKCGKGGTMLSMTLRRPTISGSGTMDCDDNKDDDNDVFGSFLQDETSKINKLNGITISVSTEAAFPPRQISNQVGVGVILRKKQKRLRDEGDNDDAIFENWLDSRVVEIFQFNNIKRNTMAALGNSISPPHQQPHKKRPRDRDLPSLIESTDTTTTTNSHSPKENKNDRRSRHVHEEKLELELGDDFTTLLNDASQIFSQQNNTVNTKTRSSDGEFELYSSLMSGLLQSVTPEHNEHNGAHAGGVRHRTRRRITIHCHVKRKKCNESNVRDRVTFIPTSVDVDCTDPHARSATPSPDSNTENRSRTPSPDSNTENRSRTLSQRGEPSDLVSASNAIMTSPSHSKRRRGTVIVGSSSSKSDRMPKRRMTTRSLVNSMVGAEYNSPQKYFSVLGAQSVDEADESSLLETLTEHSEGFASPTKTTTESRRHSTPDSQAVTDAVGPPTNTTTESRRRSTPDSQQAVTAAVGLCYEACACACSNNKSADECSNGNADADDPDPGVACPFCVQLFHTCTDRNLHVSTRHPHGAIDEAEHQDEVSKPFHSQWSKNRHPYDDAGQTYCPLCDHILLTNPTTGSSTASLFDHLQERHTCDTLRSDNDFVSLRSFKVSI